MKKDQLVFIVNFQEIREGIFVSQSNSYCYVLDKTSSVVSGHDPKTIFETKEAALEYLVVILKDKLRNVTLWENRIKEVTPLLDKIQEVSKEFDLKKAKAKHE